MISEYATKSYFTGVALWSSIKLEFESVLWRGGPWVLSDDVSFWRYVIVSTLWELYVLVFPYGFLIWKSGEAIQVPSLKCQVLFKIEKKLAPNYL